MHRYKVVAAKQITPSTLLLTLRQHDGSIPFTYQPGQYAVINYYRRHRPSVVRCFSIVTSPTQQGYLQFAMRTRGRFTRALSQLLPGDTVSVRGPFGGFVLDQTRDKRVLMIAGGIGITPFMSMARFAAATKSSTDIDLVYCCSHGGDVPFLEELKQLQQINPRFRVTFVLNQAPADALTGQRVVVGRPDANLLASILKPEQLAGTSVMLCGPPPFMKGVNKSLQQLGVDKHAVMTEAFSRGPRRQTGKVINWPINMYMATAVGLGVSSFAIMVADLLKTMPPSSIFGANSTIRRQSLTNSRQQDLDSLVNQLPDQSSGNPSPAASQALSQQAQTLSSQSASQQQSSTRSSSSASQQQSQPSTPPPCQTTVSGVTQC